MKYTEKKALYESIMKDVARTVKRRLNEDEKLANFKTLNENNITDYVHNIDKTVFDNTGDYYFRVYGSTLKLGKRYMDRYKKPNPKHSICAIVLMDQYLDLLYSGKYNPFRDSFKDFYDDLVDRTVDTLIEIFELRQYGSDPVKKTKNQEIIHFLPDLVKAMLSWVKSKY